MSEWIGRCGGFGEVEDGPKKRIYYGREIGMRSRMSFDGKESSIGGKE